MTAQPSFIEFLPKRIAIVLFAGGLFWALGLLIFIPGLISIGAWPGVIYFTCGYAVYFGWFWRIRHIPSRFIAAVLWLSSIAVNSYFMVYCYLQDHKIPIDSSSWLISGWWILASILSLVALIFDLLPRKHDA